LVELSKKATMLGAILVAVLLFSVLIAFLGLFPVTAPPANWSRSNNYWWRAEPIMVEGSHIMCNGTASLILLNSGNKTITLLSVGIGDGKTTLNRKMAPVDVERNLIVQVRAKGTFDGGDYYFPMNITYLDENGIQRSETGWLEGPWVENGCLASNSSCSICH
jgi:hypothetical protein